MEAVISLVLSAILILGFLMALAISWLNDKNNSNCYKRNFGEKYNENNSDSCYK